MTAAPSTRSGTAATTLGAYRHCHTLKMINKEILLQHLDTASSRERRCRRDSKLFLFRFELPWIQMSLTGNRPSLLVDKPQVLWLKQANPCRAIKLNGSLETFRIILKLGLSVLPFFPSDYPFQWQSCVKQPRIYKIHLAGPHLTTFFEIITITVTEGTVPAETIH